MSATIAQHEGAITRHPSPCETCGRRAPLRSGLCWPCAERRDRRLLAEFWLQDESGPQREVALAEADMERAKRVRAGVA